MEIWKDIQNFEGLYQASNLGRIKSFWYGKEKIISQTLGSHGYYSLHLCKNNIRKVYLVHRLIYQTFKGELIKGLVIDHISGDKLDNRLENLQQVSPRQNSVKGDTCKNTFSKYVGVSWHKKNNKWMSRISINGKRKVLGNYKTELEAHEAYQKALKSNEDI